MRRNIHIYYRKISLGLEAEEEEVDSGAESEEAKGIDVNVKAQDLEGPAKEAEKAAQKKAPKKKVEKQKVKKAAKVKFDD